MRYWRPHGSSAAKVTRSESAFLRCWVVTLWMCRLMLETVCKLEIPIAKNPIPKNNCQWKCSRWRLWIREMCVKQHHTVGHPSQAFCHLKTKPHATCRWLVQSAAIPSENRKLTKWFKKLVEKSSLAAGFWSAIVSGKRRVFCAIMAKNVQLNSLFKNPCSLTRAIIKIKYIAVCRRINYFFSRSHSFLGAFRSCGGENISSTECTFITQTYETKSVLKSIISFICRTAQIKGKHWTFIVRAWIVNWRCLQRWPEKLHVRDG